MDVKSINVSNKNDFISREAAIQKRHGCNMDCSICDFAADGDSWCNGELFVVDLMRVPAADVQPMVRARWVNTMHGWECSHCHVEQEYTKWFDYCPYCGAHMIEDKGDYKDV